MKKQAWSCQVLQAWWHDTV